MLLLPPWAWPVGKDGRKDRLTDLPIPIQSSDCIVHHKCHFIARILKEWVALWCKQKLYIEICAASSKESLN